MSDFHRVILVSDMHYTTDETEQEMKERWPQAKPSAAAGDAVVIEAVVAAQNPTLNPLLLVTAIETRLPEYKPAQVRCRRLELYDEDMQVFR